MKEKGITTYTQLEYFTLNVNYLKKKSNRKILFLLKQQKIQNINQPIKRNKKDVDVTNGNNSKAMAK